MNRPKGRFPGAEDPLGLVQDELDGRSRSEAPPRPRRFRPGDARQAPARTHDDFPPCPAERSENTWRLVRLFVETGKAYGRTRVVSPWQLGEDLAFKINHDRAILEFVRDHRDLLEDLLSRMIRIYWKHYVTDRMSRTQILNEYLDDYWADLWDQAKTEYATDEIQRLEAAGQLKTIPRNLAGSLQNDAEYQAVLADLRTDERIRAQLSNSNHQLESDQPEPQS